MGKITVEVKINTFGTMKHPNGVVEIYYLLTSSDELYHFDTTAFTFSNRWHVMFVHCVVERVVAPRILPRIAFETLDCSTTYKRRK